MSCYPYLTDAELWDVDSGDLHRAEAAQLMAGRELDWPMEVTSNISAELKQLLEGLLHKDPSQRAQGAQVRRGWAAHVQEGRVEGWR